MHLDDPVPSLKRGADRYRRPRQMRALFTSENREMKKARIPAAAAAGAALLLAQAAAARDLSRLSDRVLPVYIAQNIAAVCSVGNRFCQRHRWSDRDHPPLCAAHEGGTQQRASVRERRFSHARRCWRGPRRSAPEIKTARLFRRTDRSRGCEALVRGRGQAVRRRRHRRP